MTIWSAILQSTLVPRPGVVSIGGPRAQRVDSTAAFLAIAATALVACGPDTGSGDDGPMLCDECDLDENYVVGCLCDLNEDGLFCDGFSETGEPEANSCIAACIDNSTNIFEFCDQQCDAVDQANSAEPGYAVGFQHVSCIGNPDSGSCSGWSPASYITLSSGTYHVDAEWLADLAADPSPLWTCDDAYFAVYLNSRFQVKNASSGEFLYQLGLRNDWRIESVNGYPLTNWGEVMIAAGMLYFGGETTYVLTVKKPLGITSTLTYVLD